MGGPRPAAACCAGPGSSAEMDRTAAHRWDPDRRDVPAEYASWQTFYGLFRRWQRDGTWAKILAAVQTVADAAGCIGWDVSIDSATSRAHQHAVGARHHGTCRKNHPAACTTSPLTTPWGVRAAG